MFKNLKGLKVSVLLYCCMQMSMLGISSVITELIKYFPGYSVTTIQFLATFPDIMIVITSLICGKIMYCAGKKRLVAVSGLLFILTAIGGFIFHETYCLLLVWSGTLGIAIGILIPTAVAIINDEVEEKYKTAILGVQNAAIGLGGITVILLGGLLSVKKWFFCYLIYLLAIPGTWGLICYLKEPEKKEKISVKSGKVNWTYTVYFSVIAFLFFSLYNALSANAALLLAEIGILNTIKVSVIIGALMLGSAVAGLLFDRIFSIIKINTIFLGMFLLCLGIWVMIMFPNYYLVFAGMMIAGSSLSLVMATLTAIVMQECKEYNANMSIAIILALSDCGGFFSPVYTELSNRIFQQSTVMKRYFMISQIVIILCVCMYIVTKFSSWWQKKKSLP